MPIGALQYYTSGGLLTLFDMRTRAPIAHPYALQNAALSDCLFRAMRRHRYVVNTDFDEFIVPQGNVRTWAALADAFFRSAPASEYVFRNSFHSHRVHVPFVQCATSASDAGEARNASGASRVNRTSSWCVEVAFADAIPALAMANGSLLSDLRALHALMSARAPLATLWQTTRERHVWQACWRSKVIALAADVAFPGIHQVPRLHPRAPRRYSNWTETARDCLHGPEHSRIVPSAVALVHHFQSFHDAPFALPAEAEPFANNTLLDRSLWRYSNALYTAMASALKEIQVNE